MTETPTGLSTTPTRAAVVPSVSDWRAAVRAATGLLVDLGVADEDYVHACIASVEQHGPYIVLTQGVALAHAQVEPGRTGDGLTLVRLDSPVDFGHPTNDPVDLVFAFSTAGRHLDMIRAFGRALGSGLPDDLRGAATEAELAALLTRVTSDA
jgi:ascorbate PTS system EIIA or EIIAB component